MSLADLGIDGKDKIIITYI